MNSNLDENYIVFDNVRKTYYVGEVGINAANNVSFYINKSEFVVIVGASGAGKTTVLNLLGGIDMCDAGEIIVGDSVVSDMSQRELTVYRRYNIGFVFQFYNLIPNLTARENIELAVQISDSDADIEQIINNVELSDRADNFPAQLSGGEQQRVAIARALAKKPKLLLCDEPTGALDDQTGRTIIDLLHRTCREQNMTVVLITHNTAIVPIADRVIKMRNGQVLSNSLNDNPVPADQIKW